MSGRILIVEGDEAVRNALCRALLALGLEADELTNGGDVVDRIHSGRYAIVLLDLTLPGTDTFALLHSLHKDEGTPVVIALSAGPDDVRRLAGDPVVTLAINKEFALRNIDPVLAAIAAVSRMR
jgi:DNA-binding response OmpR family regulator